MTKRPDDSSGPSVKQAVHNTAQEAKREGQRLASKATEHAETVAEERKKRAADYMRGVSAAMRSGGQTLEKEGYEGTAGLVEQAAGQVHDLATNFANRGPRDLLQEVERFAKERPTLFVGAALLTGLGISRFLKSSPPTERSTADTRQQGFGSEMPQRPTRETAS